MACPMAMQVHWARMPASAIRSVDTIRPAAVIRELPFGINALDLVLVSAGLTGAAAQGLHPQDSDHVGITGAVDDFPGSCLALDPPSQRRHLPKISINCFLH